MTLITACELTAFYHFFYEGCDGTTDGSQLFEKGSTKVLNLILELLTLNGQSNIGVKLEPHTRISFYFSFFDYIKWLKSFVVSKWMVRQLGINF